MLFLDEIWTAVGLNLLWLLCCLPIVTIGASTCAFYETARKRLVLQEGRVFSIFFKSFRTNFPQATIIGLIWTVLVAVCVFASVYAGATGNDIFQYLLLVQALFFSSLSLWCAALISRFENKTFLHLRNGLFLGIGHLGNTIILMVLLAVTALGVWLILPLVFALPVGLMGFWTRRLEKVFIKDGFVNKEED
jgi:uncharacterized membrane protein YesL